MPHTAPVYSEFQNDEDFRELLEEFAVAIPDRLKSVEMLLAAADWQELSRVAHQIKGAGGGFGFPELSEKASSLEQACKEAVIERIAADAAELIAFARRIRV